ncbi:MAG TPA: glutamyl-tRNA amidotransferase [Chromatiales bacterium]|nr:glutamyl-tRNA amidotransferase [Chromatiales bacterium]
MKRLIRRCMLIFIVTAGSLSACNMERPTVETSKTEREQRAMEALAWVEDADAERDAQRALDRGDTALLGIASRVTVLPGIPSSEYARYKTKCGVRLLPGSSDRVYGKRHLELLKKMHRYAERYNRIIKDACN